jgi:hypothetical protein
MNENTDQTVQALTLPQDPILANVEATERLAPAIARMRKSLYDQYVAAGFSADQALQLCVK